MFFEYDLAIPLNTPRTAPERKTLKLTKGLVHYISFFFPPGCNNMVHVAVDRGLHQVYPCNPDGYVKGNNCTVKGKVFYYIKTDPFQFEARGWSKDTVYNHTVTIRFWIMHPWQLNPFSDEFHWMTLEDSKGMIK